MEERERKLTPSGLNRTCMGAEEECPQPVALDERGQLSKFLVLRMLVGYTGEI